MSFDSIKHCFALANIVKKTEKCKFIFFTAINNTCKKSNFIIYYNEFRCEFFGEARIKNIPEMNYV